MIVDVFSPVPHGSIVLPMTFEEDLGLNPGLVDRLTVTCVVCGVCSFHVNL